MKIKIWDPNNEDEEGSEAQDLIYRVGVGIDTRPNILDRWIKYSVEAYAERYFSDCAGEWKGGELLARVDDGELRRFQVSIDWSPDFTVTPV